MNRAIALVIVRSFIKCAMHARRMRAAWSGDDSPQALLQYGYQDGQFRAYRASAKALGLEVKGRQS